MAESPFTTPKRKRSQMLGEDMPRLNTTTQFTFDLHSVADDGNSSPRTRVAHRFRGLALGGGGDGGGGRTSPVDSRTTSNEPEDESRKRRKIPDIEMADVDSTSAPGAPAESVEETTQNAQKQPKQTLNTQQQQSPRPITFALDTSIVARSEAQANAVSDITTANGETTTYTIATEAAQSSSPPTPSRLKWLDRNKPRGRGPATAAKRIGTPPLAPRPKLAPDAAGGNKDNSPQLAAVTDPVRAALTWHDDEITIYDPDDSDDDGTGINGIGFKPTPAVAYARTVRRRQQLAEYRKREEREARAKRSQRRRGSPAPAPGGGMVEIKGKGKVERRRVRFLESAAELIGV